MSFSPAELVKLSVIIFTAYGLSIQKDRVKYFSKGVLPYLIILILASALIICQPDLGTAVSLAGIIFVMIFAAGARLSHLGSLCLAGIVAVGLAIYLEPYRMRRFLAFLDPWAVPRTPVSILSRASRHWLRRAIRSGPGPEQAEIPVSPGKSHRLHLCHYS